MKLNTLEFSTGLWRCKACPRARAHYSSACRFRRGLLHTSREEILLERSEWTLSSQTGESAAHQMKQRDSVDSKHLISISHGKITISQRLSSAAAPPHWLRVQMFVFSTFLSKTSKAVILFIFLWPAPILVMPSVGALNLLHAHIEPVQRFHLKKRK